MWPIVLSILDRLRRPPPLHLADLSEHLQKDLGLFGADGRLLPKSIRHRKNSDGAMMAPLHRSPCFSE